MSSWERRRSGALVALVAVGAGALAVARRRRRRREGPVPADDRVSGWSDAAATVAHEPEPPVSRVTAPPAVDGPPPVEPPAAPEASPSPPSGPRAALTAPRPPRAVPARARSKAPLLALALLALVVALAAGLATGSSDDEPAGAVLGTKRTQAATTTPTTTTATSTTAATEAAPALPSATRATTLRARGLALLSSHEPQLAELVGARVKATKVRVDAVVGDDIYWVGSGSERLLVHLQGTGTRFAVRRGQRLSFTGVLTRTPSRAAAAWGLSAAEGRAQLNRQGHHIEVFGPHIRFDCVRRCGGFR